VKFKQKGVWVHNAVAEVWLCFLVREIRSEAHAPLWLQGMAEEIELALEAGWIDGVISSVFDAHLESVDKVELFLPRLSSAKDEILAQASKQQAVNIDKFDASSAFVIPETLMLERLFAHPEEISEPWKVFTLRDGWRIA
jgi:hypothetical protein